MDDSRVNHPNNQISDLFKFQVKRRDSVRRGTKFYYLKKDSFNFFDDNFAIPGTHNIANSRRSSIFKDMFFNNNNFSLQNSADKLFVFDETIEAKKRKSLSFCAKDDPNKEINLFQNVIGGDQNIEKVEQESKSKS